MTRFLPIPNHDVCSCIHLKLSIKCKKWCHGCHLLEQPRLRHIAGDGLAATGWLLIRLRLGSAESLVRPAADSPIRRFVDSPC